jgi:hypothetical protein
LKSPEISIRNGRSATAGIAHGTSHPHYRLQLIRIRLDRRFRFEKPNSEIDHERGDTKYPARISEGSLYQCDREIPCDLMINCRGPRVSLGTIHDIIIVHHSKENWAKIAYSPILHLEHDTASQPFNINYWSYINSSVDQGREIGRGLSIVTIHQILNYKKWTNSPTRFIDLRPIVQDLLSRAYSNS